MGNGGLKSINSGVPATDPGGDGIAGVNSTFMKDVFGETLHYHDQDYASAWDPGSVNLGTTPFQNQFAGNLRAITYNNSTDKVIGATANETRIFGYQYDNRNQLTNAQWGSVNGSTAVFGEPQRESVGSGGYDKNGNILSMLRKGKAGQDIANYSYVYENNTNKLDKIDQNSSTFIDYTYNSIGQMTQQSEGQDKVYHVTYNAYGLVKEVRNGTNQPVLKYYYDDRGDLVKKERFDEGSQLALTTYSVSDVSGNTIAIYEAAGGNIVLKELPLYGVGRIGVYKPPVSTFFFEVNDHLGNVRAVIGSPSVVTYNASMESELSEDSRSDNLKIFKNIAATRVTFNTANKTPQSPQPNVTYNEVVRLNKDKPAGPTLELAVSPGDVINVNVWAYYEGGGANFSSPLSGTTMLHAIALAFGGIQGAPGEAGRIYNTVQSGFNGTIGDSSDPDAPSAFLTCVIYDNNYSREFWTSKGVTTSANGSHQQLVMDPIKIEKPGYIYISLYNRSDHLTPVYFDELTVTVTPSPVVAGADYYPFGLPLDASEITDEPYRYGYQGQYSEENEHTGWNEFELRMYDARLGRWLSADPYGQYYSLYMAMNNAPHMSVDPDGGWNPYLTGALVGAGVFTIAGAIFDDDFSSNWWKWTLGGAAAGAASVWGYSKITNSRWEKGYATMVNGKKTWHNRGWKNTGYTKAIPGKSINLIKSITLGDEPAASAGQLAYYIITFTKRNSRIIEIGTHTKRNLRSLILLWDLRM
jgi:RHS repeat-associated protein